MKRPRALTAGGIALAIALVIMPGVVASAKSRCDAPGTDAAAVAATRRAIEGACPCDGFASHGKYVACAKRTVSAEAAAGRLARGCRAAVRAIAQRSTCSWGKPRVVCCSERCSITSAARCGARKGRVGTACGQVAFCADAPCDLGAPTCDPEVLYSPEGNRLRRYDLDSVRQPPLVEDVFIERASDGGLDINGQVCPLPDRSGRFVAGEDTGQPTIVPGWGVFDAAGTMIGKLTPTYQTDVGGGDNDEPYGCAFDRDGRLFTSDIGNQASGDGNGQLIVWFPPYDTFPGPPGTYPNSARSTNYCKLATDLTTAGGVATDAQGRVYVAATREGTIYRFSPPFPTGPDAAGGCGRTDALGSPLATEVKREVFISAPKTFSGIARARNGNWLVSTVFNGTIEEYDANGTFLRTLQAPAAGETAPPWSVGHPQGLAVDCRGDLYYADLALRISDDGIGPGPNGTVRRLPFDVCGAPQPAQIVRAGLAFPDGLGILPGSLP